MIYFLQPVLAKYRVPFFNELAKLQKEKIKVIYSKVDFLGVESCTPESPSFGVKEVGNFFSFFGVFFWQIGLPVFSFKREDTVVLSGNPRVINQMLVFFICKIKKIPVIWWGQGWTAGRSGFMSKIRRKLMLKSDAVVLYTEEEAASFKGKNHVIGLNNGLDFKEISKYREQNSLRFKKGKVDILFIGRFSEKANLNLLFATMEKLDDKFTFHMVGDGKLYEYYRSSYVTKTLNCNIHFYGAVYSEYEISLIANKCDAFVYTGAVGLSLIHGFCYALPAIVHDRKSLHMPEFSAFKDGYNGFSFNYGCPNSLEKVFLSLLDPNLAVMSENALNTVKCTFNTSDMALRFITALDKVKEGSND